MPTFFEDPTKSMDSAAIQRALQAAHARANHAHTTNRSTGPRTPEGKAASSRNALKHGFTAANPAISSEERDAWEALFASYLQDFLPVTQAETDAIRRAALAIWKLDRLTQLETALFNLEVEYHGPAIDAYMSEDLTPMERMAAAFKASAGDRVFELCHRYSQSASREHDRALRTFYFLQSKRLNQAAAPPETPEKAQEPNELPKNAARKPVLVPARTETPQTKTLQPTKTEEIAS
jgi:hypothetical protein